MRNAKVKKDVYQDVTNKIIASLESGVAPWVKPWTSGGQVENPFGSRPFNFSAKREYHGINTLLLSMAEWSRGFDDAAWITYRQAKTLGGNVRKGEHGEHVVFWKECESRTETDDNGKPKRFLVARQYTVFNIAQCDGLEIPAKQNRPVVPVAFNAISKAEIFVNSVGAEIKHGGNRAFFSPELDYIQLPHKEQFDTESNYYATALHELTHWSGRKDRLDRDLQNRFGSHKYAAEELIAELGAAFLCADLNISGRLQHDSYIDSWLKVLREDSKAIFTAASKAEKAVAYLHDRQPAEVKKAA